MRPPARYRNQILNALWSPETFRVLFVGLLAWSVSALALVVASAYGFDALPASTLRATALAVGFAVGAAAVVFYGAWRYLAEPRRLAGALGAGAILSLPLLVGILVPALLSFPGADVADHAARMLELGLLLLLCTHAAFAVTRGGDRRRGSQGLRLVPELLLLAMVLGVAMIPMVEAPLAAVQPFEVAVAPVR